MTDNPEPKTEDTEELPDAWERFEKAFDTVMKAKPKPAPPKGRGALPKDRPKRDQSKP